MQANPAVFSNCVELLEKKHKNFGQGFHQVVNHSRNSVELFHDQILSFKCPAIRDNHAIMLCFKYIILVILGGAIFSCLPSTRRSLLYFLISCSILHLQTQKVCHKSCLNNSTKMQTYIPSKTVEAYNDQLLLYMTIKAI